MNFRHNAKALTRHKPGVMNDTESAYEDILKEQFITGEIKEYHFEAITLKLAKDCRYTPDFMVVDKDDIIEFREVKGRWMDDARVKIKVAAKMFPFKFHILP